MLQDPNFLLRDILFRGIKEDANLGKFLENLRAKFPQGNNVNDPTQFLWANVLEGKTVPLALKNIAEVRVGEDDLKDPVELARKLIKDPNAIVMKEKYFINNTNEILAVGYIKLICIGGFPSGFL
jgi:hypothetical protein